jgi:hypothetical protein
MVDPEPDLVHVCTCLFESPHSVRDDAMASAAFERGRPWRENYKFARAV